MFFYLLMQPNHIETLHRKVFMRINDDYYIENVYTLIRVPNNSANLDEFASRYFCLQSNQTHNVYIVWKRRNRVKRINRNSSLTSKSLFKPEVLSKSTSKSSLLKRSSSTSKSKLPKSLSSIKYRSVESINELSDSSINSLNEYSNKSKSSKFKNKICSKTIDALSNKNFKFLSLKKFSKSKLFLSRPRLIEETIKAKKISKKNKFNPMNKANYQKLPAEKTEVKLFKVFKSKFKSFNSKVHDETVDSFKILSKDLSRDLSRDQSRDSSRRISLNLSDMKNGLITDNQFHQVDNKKSKKLFFNLIDKLSSKTNNFVQNIRSSKDEYKKIKNAKKKVKSVFQNIQYNLINLISSKKDK